jgi:hypothetical protein
MEGEEEELREEDLEEEDLEEDVEEGKRKEGEDEEEEKDERGEEERGRRNKLGGEGAMELENARAGAENIVDGVDMDVKGGHWADNTS